MVMETADYFPYWKDWLVLERTQSPSELMLSGPSSKRRSWVSTSRLGMRILVRPSVLGIEPDDMCTSARMTTAIASLPGDLYCIHLRIEEKIKTIFQMHSLHLRMFSYF